MTVAGEEGGGDVVGLSAAPHTLDALVIAVRALHAAASHPVCSEAALGGGLPERLVHPRQTVQHPQCQLLERKTSFNEDGVFNCFTPSLVTGSWN